MVKSKAIMLKLPFLALLCHLVVIQCVDKFIINTWSGPFEAATAEAFDSLENGGSPLDAIEAGCKKCENNQCDGTVGYGNHPGKYFPPLLLCRLISVFWQILLVIPAWMR